MTPTERLQAAIDNLEQLRAESSGPNPWIVDRDFPQIVLHPDQSGNSWDGTVVADTGQDELGLPRTPADARLIVTLHRTIDAQLAILRFAHEGLYDLPEFVALADAILGGTE